MHQITMCNVKGFAHSIEPIENEPQSLLSQRY